MASTNQFMKQISAAAGRTKAELVLKHAKIVNVFTETVEEGGGICLSWFFGWTHSSGEFYGDTVGI